MVAFLFSQPFAPPPEKSTPPKEGGICLTPPLKSCKRKHNRSVYALVL
jgi:hypothetical protein